MWGYIYNPYNLLTPLNQVFRWFCYVDHLWLSSTSNRGSMGSNGGEILHNCHDPGSTREISGRYSTLAETRSVVDARCKIQTASPGMENRSQRLDYQTVWYRQPSDGTVNFQNPFRLKEYHLIHFSHSLMDLQNLRLFQHRCQTVKRTRVNIQPKFGQSKKRLRLYTRVWGFSCPCGSGVSTLTKLSLSRCWNYCSINFNFYIGYAQVSGDSAPSARRGRFCDRVWPSPGPVRRWATTLCICSYEGGSQVRGISKRFESLSLTVFCHQMAHYRSDRYSPLPGWRRRIWWVPNSKRQCSDWKCLVSLGVKSVPNKLIYFS